MTINQAAKDRLNQCIIEEPRQVKAQSRGRGLIRPLSNNLLTPVLGSARLPIWIPVSSFGKGLGGTQANFLAPPKIGDNIYPRMTPMDADVDCRGPSNPMRLSRDGR